MSTCTSIGSIVLVYKINMLHNILCTWTDIYSVIQKDSIFHSLHCCLLGNTCFSFENVLNKVIISTFVSEDRVVDGGWMSDCPVGGRGVCKASSCLCVWQPVTQTRRSVVRRETVTITLPCRPSNYSTAISLHSRFLYGQLSQTFLLFSLSLQCLAQRSSFLNNKGKHVYWWLEFPTNNYHNTSSKSG